MNLALVLLLGCGATSQPASEANWSLGGCLVTASETSHLDDLYASTWACSGTVVGEPWVYTEWRVLSWDCRADAGYSTAETASWTSHGCESAFREEALYPSNDFARTTTREATCDDHGQPVYRTERVVEEQGGDERSDETTDTSYASTYDDDGRLVMQDVEETGPYSDRVATTEWVYDTGGRLESWTEDETETRNGDADASTTSATLTYDGDLLVTERVEETDEDGTTVYVVHQERDALDRLVGVVTDWGDDGVPEWTETYAWVGDTPWIASYSLEKAGWADDDDIAFEYECP